MKTEARFDVVLHRYGALGIKELEAAAVDSDRGDVDEFLALQMNTLGPGDTALLEIHRHGPESA